MQIAQANGDGGTTPATETTETPPAHKLNVPLPNAPVTATFTASEGARIVLPEGATVDTIMVRGNDLILVQADGSIILIVDGAKYPPELVVAGIDIPADQLAQIVHNVPEGVPAAGPEAGGEHTPSSGGNFAGPPGDIGDPFPIGPLLPPTELHFGLPEVKEIVPGLLQAAAPPDLFPVQVAGATVNGVVEEEQFTGNEPQSGAGKGNEDTRDANGLDTDGTGPQVTLEVHGTLAGLATGGNPPLTFSITDVTTDAIVGNEVVTDTAGNPVTSLGVPVTYTAPDLSVPDQTTVRGVADGRVVFTLTVHPDGTFDFILNDTIDHPIHGPFPAGEDALNLNLTSLILVTDHDGDPLILTGNAFTITVIDDTPITSANAAVQLDDDALTGGNAGGTDDQPDSVNATGTLAHSYGADSPGTTLLTGVALPNASLSACGSVRTAPSSPSASIRAAATVEVLRVTLTDTSRANTR